METISVNLPLLPFLLFLISLCTLSVDSSPKFLNITTLSTYSLVSPGVPGPGAEEVRDSSEAKGAEAGFDSSAAASDQSGRSAGVHGAHGARHPAQILGKPSGEGHWATPAPHSGIGLPYVPYKMFAQVRHTYEVNHKPQSDAVASATTAEEAAAAARLRESIQTKKISEVYSEEGYEDSAYDHAGFKKDAGFSEGHEEHEGAKRKKGNTNKGGGISEAETISEEQKYPFHKVSSSEAVPILSPLRYALNPASGAVPPKSRGGTEFYDSTDSVECPVVVDLPPIPGRKFSGSPDEEKEEEGQATEEEEESEKTPKPAPPPPPPPSPRLKGLGDKIDCLKRKFFGGDEPLDNPLFKEQVVNVAKNEIRKAKEEAESRRDEVEVKGEESKDSPLQKQEKVERVDGKVAEPNSSANVQESVGEDRIGVETEESPESGVGAAVEGLPSGSASDSDMQGFYADIMGHIHSATGNIVRQAYRGNEGSNSGEKVSRVRPPKPPKPPIIGFFPTQEVGLPGARYPSVLPAPSNPSYRNYADDSYGHGYESGDDDDGEEQSGSERAEEEEEGDEDDGDHHHHDHPNLVGGSRKPTAAFLLRPLHPSQTQQTAPFRPSPLLYIHNPNAQRESAPPPTRVALHPSPSGGEPPHHSHRPHHHRHSHSHTFSSHSPYQSGGYRTFLIPAGKRPTSFSSSPYRYHSSPIRGIRGSGTILLPAPVRQHPNPVFQNGFLYPVRDSPSNSLKRQLPAGHEFDGLLTATTQSISLALPPLGLGRPSRPQPIQDLESSPSISKHSIDAPRNIEYFTLKDSIPPKNDAQLQPQHSSQVSQTLISEITFTTTERNPSPGSSAEGYVEGEVSSQGSADGGKLETADSVASASSYESDSIERPYTDESMETSDSFLEGAVADSGEEASGEMSVAGGSGGGISARLVTEQVTKGIVRGAIEEAIRKRRKNVEETVTAAPETGGAVETETKSREERRKNRARSRVRGEGRAVATESGEGGETDRGREKDAADGGRRIKAARTVDSRRERIRRGEKGSSRTRVGLTQRDGEPNVGSRAPRGRKRGEPSHNSPRYEDVSRSDEEIAEESEVSSGREHNPSANARTSKNSGQQIAEDRMGVVPTESRVSHAALGQRFTSSNEKSPRGSPEEQIDRKSGNPAEDRPIRSEETDTISSQTQTTVETAEALRKKFVEPRVRGEKRPKIPKKSAARPRVAPAQNINREDANLRERTTENDRSEPRRRESSSASDPAVKRWEMSKGRIITALEEVADSSRRQGRQRESAHPSVGNVNATVRPIIVAEPDSRSNPKKPKVTRHRQVKETYTALYAPEDEA